MSEPPVILEYVVRGRKQRKRQRRTKRFDPNQPRDPHTGEWVETGYNERLYAEMDLDAFGGLTEGYEPTEAFGESEQDPLFAAGFSFTETTALNFWSTPRGYETINRAARFGSEDEREDALIDAIDSAIEHKGKPWRGGALYRGVDLDTFDAVDRGEMLTPGSVITDDGFGASTPERAAALTFARGGTPFHTVNTAKEPALVSIDEVDGNVLDLNEPMKGEWNEVLFPRGTSYEIRSVELGDDGLRVIHVKVITDPHLEKDFDPHQPRDRRGRWTEVLGGTVGATPFTGAEASYGAAAARWDDPEWKSAFDGFEEELGEMGFTRQIGVYQGSFEPSYSVHVDGPDGLTKVRAMDSLQTQEAVSAFIYDPDGDDVEVTIADVGNPDQFFADLSKLGIEGGSFANGGFSTWVSDPEQAEALQDLATEREIGFSAHAGRIDW